MLGLDLTYLLRNGTTHYPSVMDGKPSNSPNPEQKLRARKMAQSIIDKFCPGTSNPY
jgi:hypothetical protein